MNAKANYTNDKVRKLQRKLYLSAKANNKRKYHALYDKVYRRDILIEEWKRVKANKGSGGIDNISIELVQIYGVDKLIDKIYDELMGNKYYPKPVKRVHIPKKDGSKRALGIPTIKDRIIQMATKIVIEPIFEADFKETSYGFRPKRNQHQALSKIKTECDAKGYWVLDADIKSYFDTINHEKLIQLIQIRISDKRIIKLIKKWLNVGCVDNHVYKNTSIGAPQGGVISPLLSNIYLNYFDTKWKRHYSHLGKLIRFADDFVIIGKSRWAIEKAHLVVKNIMERLEIDLHPEKTKIVGLEESKQSFVFLGFEHRRETFKTLTNRIITMTRQHPSSKAMFSMREKIREVLDNRQNLQLSLDEVVKILNRKLQGFKNYYRLRYLIYK
ncbi:MAG: group II intron reverse transcriptase/maturase [Cellulosilyticaceae bacterium]